MGERSENTLFHSYLAALDNLADSDWLKFLAVVSHHFPHLVLLGRTEITLTDDESIQSEIITWQNTESSSVSYICQLAS